MQDPATVAEQSPGAVPAAARDPCADFYRASVGIVWNLQFDLFVQCQFLFRDEIETRLVDVVEMRILIPSTRFSVQTDPDPEVTPTAASPFVHDFVHFDFRNGTIAAMPIVLDVIPVSPAFL